MKKVEIASVMRNTSAEISLIRLAIRSTPSPFWEKAFIVMLFSSSKTALPHQSMQQSSLWYADFNRRGRAKHDHGGKQEANR